MNMQSERTIGGAPAATVFGAVAAVNLLAALLLSSSITAAMDGVPGAMRTLLWIAAFTSPLIAAIRALVFTGFTWAVAALLGDTGSPRHAFGVGLIGEVILALSAVFSGVVILIRGEIDSPADLEVAQGVDLFVDVDPGWPAIVVEHTGVFYVLWAVAMWVGLQRAAGMGRWSSAGAVGAYWLTLLATGMIRHAAS